MDETTKKWRDSYAKSADTHDVDTVGRYKWHSYPWENLVGYWDAILRMIPPRPMRVLEAGCGGGHLAEMIKEKRPDLEYQGFDIVPQNVADARARVPGFEFREGNYWETMSNPRTWDFVLSCGVLFTTTAPEHIERLYQLLDAAAPQGFAVIATIFRKQGIPGRVLRPLFEETLQRSANVTECYYKGKRDFFPPDVAVYNRPFYIWRDDNGDAPYPDLPEGLVDPDVHLDAEPPPPTRAELKAQKGEEYEGGLFDE